MAEKTTTAGSKRKGKTVFEKATARIKATEERNKTRVVIGTAFQRWRQLKEENGLQTDAKLAQFLLDSYDASMAHTSSTPLKSSVFKLPPPPPSLSNIGPESSLDSDILSTSDAFVDVSVEQFNDIQNSTIDWDDDETWDSDMDKESVSSLEEDVTREMDTDSDDSDADYMRTGGALKTSLRLETLPTVGSEESVLDDVDCNRDSARTDTPLPEAMKVVVEDDVIGHPASIVYHDCLRQLAGCVALPMTECTEKDPMTNKQCSAKAPFEIRIKSQGTAAVAEWMCSQGHLVWRWSSQPMFKFGMLVGDFMLATNISLSGNNYAKISLLFKFMNMGMADRSNFCKIQDSFRVKTLHLKFPRKIRT
ncbi:uncharacterized protein PAE49_017857 [Odontesthes bonariensis]|uniref:uncharacterized protein LOC142401632 n=1 Tax=Odontesthes bonariensis TaxID=219752 RepID=UPI003F58655A